MDDKMKKEGIKIGKINGMNKRGQVAIFVILALIIVVAIILIFILRRPIDIMVIDEKNPQAFIEKCVSDTVEETVYSLSLQGGDINPKGSVAYDGENITYLCYNANFYGPCANQRPMLIEHIEKELKDSTEGKISNCFETLKTDLEKKYNVEMDEMILNIGLKPKQIVINIDRNLILTRGEDVRTFNNFNIILNNDIYDLAKIAMEIANQESEFCNFDTLGYMIIYPDYDLDKFRTGDSDTIYTIKNRKTNQEFVFAIRSCVLPPGL